MNASLPDGLEKIYCKYRVLGHMGLASGFEVFFFFHLIASDKDCYLEEMLCMWYFGLTYYLQCFITLNSFSIGMKLPKSEY